MNTDVALIAATQREARRQRAAASPLRAAATEAVIAAYRDLPLSWAGANCIRLARSQAVALGHELPEVPGFKTLRGAKRALQQQGVDSVSALLDLYFDRYPAPAFARLGDLVVGPADPAHGMEAVGIADGLGNIWGWSEQTGHSGLVAIKFGTGHVTASWRL